MIIYKTVLLGDFGVGKTSLIKRFVDNSFSEEYLSSIGVSISKKRLATEYDDKIIESTAMLWDIEGHTKIRPIFTPYLQGAKGFIIVADMTRMETINSLQQHIKTCINIAPKNPIIIALNKSDLISRKFDIDIIEQYSDNIILVVQTSAKEDYGVNEIFKQLNDHIVKGNT